MKEKFEEWKGELDEEQETGVEVWLLAKEETSARNLIGILLLTLWVLVCFLLFFLLFWCGFFQCATELEFRGCTRKWGNPRLNVTVTLLKIFFLPPPLLYSSDLRS